MNSKSTFLCRAFLYASALFASGFAGAESSIPVEPVTDPADYDVGIVDESRPWAFTMYTVWLSEEQLGDVLLFQGKLEDSQLYVAALSRKIGSLNAHVDAEIEGQVAKHAGPLQRHWEVNGLGTLRWKTFPWDKYLDTTAATGLGLSYAFDDPQFEIEAHDKSNKWLVYIMVELTFSLPEIPQWALVARVHHRSAAYGTFEDDLEGASNSAGFGLKYRF
jgi:hypothetical protein